MKKSLKKVIVTVLATTAVFTFQGNVLASAVTVNPPSIIHESSEKKNIASGVTYEKLMKFTTAGWWNINVLRVDLEDPYTEIKSLVNTSGVSNKGTVSSLVETNNALAGINGDYFYYYPYTLSLGPLVENGEIITARRDDAPEHLPSFFIDFLNNGSIDYFTRSASVTNKEKNISVNINSINSVTANFDAITLLNSHWGPTSIGTKFFGDLVEVVVVDGVVTDVLSGAEAVNIPENGYVLSVRGEKTKELLQFSVGDKLDLNVSSTPDINNIKFSIGGGSYVLQKGELKKPDLSSPGNNPRTAIGITKDGKEAILLTIDGRDSSFIGVTQEMTGAILRDLGAYNAIVLDGGGSTTMALKPLGSDKATVVNKPSEGSQRPVANGVGVYSNAPKGQLSYIEASTDDRNMFANTGRKIIIKAYDQYHNPIEVDQSKISLEIIQGKGSIKENVFRAESTGMAKIKVSYESVSTIIELNVLDEIKDLNTSLSTLSIDKDSEKQIPNFTGIDQYGREAIIYAEDIDFEIVNEVGEISNGIFHSSIKPTSGAITAKLNNAVENILVYVGYEEKIIEEFNTLTDFVFSSHPINNLGEITRNTRENSKEGRSISIKYDFSQGVGTRAGYLNFKHNNGTGLAVEGIPKKLGMWVKGDGQSVWLRGVIKDKDGKEHYIDFSKTVDWHDWKYVTADIPANIAYPISVQKIYPVETNDEIKRSGEISVDQLTALYSLSMDNLVLPNATTVIDTKNVESEVLQGGFSFSILSEPHNINQLTQYDALSTIKEKIAKNKFLFSLNGFTEEFSKDIIDKNLIALNNGYSINSDYDLKFINLDSSKKGIRATNSNQWQNLVDELNNTSSTNIIVTLSTPIWGNDGFTDKLEANLLHDYLVKSFKNGKNIFVVQNGTKNSTTLKDGVRYIEINSTTLNKPEDIYNLSMVEFVANGSDITYVIKPLFKKPTVTVLK